VHRVRNNHEFDLYLDHFEDVENEHENCLFILASLTYFMNEISGGFESDDAASDESRRHANNDDVVGADEHFIGLRRDLI